MQTQKGFSEKGDKSFTFKYIHILLKFTRKTSHSLRNVSTLQKASFSIYLDLAGSTGTTTVHA